MQEAPGSWCDRGCQRHALQKLGGALPLPDPPVQAGALHHDQGPHMVGSRAHGQTVGEVEEGEGPLAVTTLHS